MTETVHCKLVAVRNGIYTVYVFEKDNKEFIMCTKLPNWGVYNIKTGDTGFLTYEEVLAGNSYFDRDTGETKTYQFDNVYFKDFVKDNEIIKDEIIL